MRLFFKNKKLGFTLIELLVIISIIGFVTAGAVSLLNRTRIKARDARRQADMEQIYKALNLFYDQYSCLPYTAGTTCSGAAGDSDANAGGWDYSSQGGFMTFLQTAGLFSKTPVDPINNMTGDNNGGYAYRYYCYPSNGLHLGYWSEQTGAYVNNSHGGASGTNNTFVCK